MAQRAIARLGNPYPVGDVRYQPTFDEELAQYNGAKLDDVKRFYSQFAGGNSAEIAIVGDFDADAIKTLLSELFGTWKSVQPFTRVPDPLIAKPARTLTLPGALLDGRDFRLEMSRFCLSLPAGTGKLGAEFS